MARLCLSLARRHNGIDAEFRTEGDVPAGHPNSAGPPSSSVRFSPLSPAKGPERLAPRPSRTSRRLLRLLPLLRLAPRPVLPHALAHGGAGFRRNVSPTAGAMPAPLRTCLLP